MLTVGLSGGIGSGKSTVSRRLVERGAVLIDSDLLAREVVAPGTEGLAQIRDRFGAEVLASDGTLDRLALGQVIFGEADARADLNAIVHPKVASETKRRIADAPPNSIVVHDIPLLVELNRSSDYHLVVIVAAAAGLRLQRLIHDRGMTRSDAQARIDAQATDEQRRAAADVWLPNEATLDGLLATVDALWEERLVPFQHNLANRLPGAIVNAPCPRSEGGSSQVGVERLTARIRTKLLDGGFEEGLAVSIDRAPDDRWADHGSLVLRLDLGDVPSADSRLDSALLAAGFVRAPMPNRGPSAESEGEGQETFFYGADPARAVVLRVRHTPMVGT